MPEKYSVLDYQNTRVILDTRYLIFKISSKFHPLVGLLSMWFKGLIATATRLYDPCTLLRGIEMALYVLLNDCFIRTFVRKM